MNYHVEMDAALARFDQFADRHGRRELGSAVRPRARRGTAARARRLANVGLIVAAVVAATIAWGLVIGPIGLSGLFLVVLLAIAASAAVAAWPRGRNTPRVVPYAETMSNQAVVHRLGALLARDRAALPPAAARQAADIAAQLPQLESRLATLDPLDPLAQDARRLLGEHLPDLIERYQRVPARFRHERDGDGVTIDERLAASLGAAHGAIDELGRQLAHDDVAGFQTQGRFIESRYRDEAADTVGRTGG